MEASSGIITVTPKSRVREILPDVLARMDSHGEVTLSGSKAGVNKVISLAEVVKSERPELEQQTTSTHQHVQGQLESTLIIILRR
jgi:hypothetical protein